MDKILIRGARTHNLKNIDLTLPRDKLIVITGLRLRQVFAGVRYALCRRPAPLRRIARPTPGSSSDDGKARRGHHRRLSPAISIEQKSTSHNPRSTVGTITEIYDYLRLLYARVGTTLPDHDAPLEAQTVSQMVDQVPALPEGRKLMLLAPVIRERKGEHAVFDELRAQGFVRPRQRPPLRAGRTAQAGQQKKHSIDVVVDRFGSRRPAAASGRILRDGAETGGRHRAGRAHG